MRQEREEREKKGERGERREKGEKTEEKEEEEEEEEEENWYNHSEIRVLALTATATKQITKDITNHLSISPKDVLFRSPFRENISSSVSEEREKMRAIVSFFRERGGERKGREGGEGERGERGEREREVTPAIVYCSYKREVEAVVSYLLSQSFDVVGYHAGMLPGFLFFI